MLALSLPQKCSLFYANVQGKENNVAQLQDKNIMKKVENDVKPVSYETKQPDPAELNNIKQYYSTTLTVQPLLSQLICHLATNAEPRTDLDQCR